jgi:hypothetical protein
MALDLDFLEMPLIFVGIACIVLAMAWGGVSANRASATAKTESTKAVVEALKSPDLTPDTRKALEKKLIEAVEADK